MRQSRFVPFMGALTGRLTFPNLRADRRCSPPLEVTDGAVGVERRAPKAGALAEGLYRAVGEDIGPADGMPGMSNSAGRGPNFGAQLVHNNLQMRSFYVTESILNHSK